MITIHSYIVNFPALFPALAGMTPWEITGDLPAIITKELERLGKEFTISEGVAIHNTARIEDHVIIKGPAIVSAGCFIGAHAYLRGGVFLGEGVSIGPGCEIKTSLIMPNTALAHFNFAGDSIIGSQVNMEAGSVIANHFNERKNKMIDILLNNERKPTGVIKFGALVGDGSKIGANAVLSPGTILSPGTVVRRLELVEQVKYIE